MRKERKKQEESKFFGIREEAMPARDPVVANHVLTRSGSPWESAFIVYYNNYIL